MSRQMKLLDQNRVRELFEYNPETGELVWMPRPQSDFKTKRVCSIWNTRFAGRVAGHSQARGYRNVQIDGRMVYSHRLIWLYVHGEWPEVIDHINGITDDNRLVNLRNVSQSENTRNQSRAKRNTSGVTGIYKQGSKWGVFIYVEKKKRFLGYFEDKNDAIAVRKSAEIKHGFHPNHGRVAA